MTKEKIKRFIIVLSLVFTVIAIPAAPVGAVNVFKNNDDVTKLCEDGATKDSAVCASKGDDVGDLIRKIVNVLLFAIGTVSVIMIIVGGIRYTLSNGNAAEITGAKNTILYSVVGLVVAMMAWAIVNFVVGMF